MTRQLGLEQYDRISYLYDYGDEWRFYAILKEVLSEEPGDTEPAVMTGQHFGEETVELEAELEHKGYGHLL